LAKRGNAQKSSRTGDDTTHSQSQDEVESRVRELSEALDQRTRDLQEALEYQTATGEVLKIISRSTFDLQSVLDTLIESATKLCAAKRGHILRPDGEILRYAASCGAWPGFIEYLERHPVRIGSGSVAGMAAAELRTVHVQDVLQESGYQFGDLMKQQGYRTLLAVPMLRDNTLLGVIVILKTNVEPFSDRQIALVQTFADQAVIAIENARLFSELHASLDFQKATIEVLNVISRSPGDVQPVFDTIAESAIGLCAAEVSTVFRFDGEMVRLEAIQGSNLDSIEAVQRAFPMPPGDGSAASRAIHDRAIVQIPDILADSKYAIGDTASAAGFRSILAVPMLQHGQPIGVVVAGRGEPGEFHDTQVRLLGTFAEQAVIAIESARLFTETQEKNAQLEEQAAELAKLNQTLESRVAEQVEELGRMSRLERFLSPKITSLIMAGEAEDHLKTRRAEISVVYVDLRGFTAFTETTDPEEVMQVLRDYHAELGKAIMAHDGTIEHFSGDGAMILFNAPMAMDDHELRAIRMTLEIRESVGALAEGWRKRGFDLGFGAGIACGYATLGTIGFEERLDYSAIGTVCNLAARLCDEAEDGQVLISPRVFVKVEPNVDTELVGEMALKGFHKAVAVYKVTGLSGDGDPKQSQN